MQHNIICYVNFTKWILPLWRSYSMWSNVDVSFFSKGSPRICNWLHISVMTKVTEFMTRINYFCVCNVEKHFNPKQKNWIGLIWICSHVYNQWQYICLEIDVIAVVFQLIWNQQHHRRLVELKNLFPFIFMA